MWDNWTEHSELHAIKTDGILMTNCNNEYPNKKESSLTLTTSVRSSRQTAMSHISRNIIGRI